jgi:NADH dehydrogenase (ubiquinone) Fe-S protein 6
MDMVQSADVIKVPGPVATCDGGGGPLGHPIEYIQIDRADAQFPAVCKYCGNKFTGEH